MICPTCKKDSARIQVIGGRVGCSNCFGTSESGGSRTDKILTYNADRITEQQVQNEGDIITPYIVDKNTHQAIVNDDFVQKYPTQALGIFSRDELDSSGFTDLQASEEDDGAEVEFSGDQKESIGKIVNNE